jgi:hypothetical protein
MQPFADIVDALSCFPDFLATNDSARAQTTYAIDARLSGIVISKGDPRLLALPIRCCWFYLCHRDGLHSLIQRHDRTDGRRLALNFRPLLQPCGLKRVRQSSTYVACHSYGIRPSQASHSRLSKLSGPFNAPFPSRMIGPTSPWYARDTANSNLP